MDSDGEKQSDQIIRYGVLIDDGDEVISEESDPKMGPPLEKTDKK